MTPVEYNDIYDKHRHVTGRVHLRGTPWQEGEYGLVVCVWIHDGEGRLLMTRRAPEKIFAGAWESTIGAAKAGESSRQAIARELREETGIRAEESEFELISTDQYRDAFLDFYLLQRKTPLEQIVLQPGETDGAKWVTLDQIREMIAHKEVSSLISEQFKRQEQDLIKHMDV